MSLELKVPSLGESISEVQIGTWFKNPGDRVTKDEPLVEIESDKSTVEVPAPESGVLGSVLKAKGDKALVGEVIGVLEVNGAVTSSPVAATRSSVAKAPAAPMPAPVSVASPSPAPVAAAVAAPTHATAPAPVSTAAPASPASVARPAAITPPPVPQYDPAEAEVIPMTTLRKRIAQRLVEAQQNAAILTTFNQVDMSAVMALRTEYKEAFEERYGVKLGFMSFFVKAVIEGLKEVPQINGQIQGESIVLFKRYDIGVAVGGGKGLVVPVIRHADQLSFGQIEQTINEFARRAKANALMPAELQGGTFTISNGGVYGSMLSTPILNPPQSGILGLHAIEDRPVARNGQVVIRPMMYLALSYDHRLIDGREAVTFLKRVKETIEQPLRIMIEL